VGIDNLNNNPWLISLPANAQVELIKMARFKHYVKDQLVHRKGSQADGLYCVISGEVRISATTLKGDIIVFTRVQTSSWFGEIALLDGGNRTHDGHASMDTIIAILPKQAVMQACQKYPDVYQALVTLLCMHSRQAFDAINDFLLFTPAQRMAKIILERLKASENKELKIKQEELGAMVGISRQSANKILKAWEIQGWIKRNYGGLSITHMHKLYEILGDQF
jgi:CRP/FNR family cyclic AMP-dependent transcriptional regulator